MKNKLTVKIENPPVAEFCKLREKVGWGYTDQSMASASLANSLFCVSIYHEQSLVGVARIVGDGAMYFYIQDVIVDPEYQSRKLGLQLMEYIEGYLDKTAKKGATIALLAAKGKESFYEKFGYSLRPNESLGNGMCKFVL